MDKLLGRLWDKLVEILGWPGTFPLLAFIGYSLMAEPSYPRALVSFALLCMIAGVFTILVLIVAKLLIEKFLGVIDDTLIEMIVLCIAWSVSMVVLFFYDSRTHHVLFG